MANKLPNRRRLGIRFVVGFVLMSAFAGLVGAVIQLPNEYDFKRIEFPAAPDSGEPFLTEDAAGSVYASWVEKRDDGNQSLQFSKLNADASAWSEPVLIADGSNWFVNWADVPSIAVGPDGRMAAHWLEGLGTGRYAYGVRITFSDDHGQTWSSPEWLHEDESSSEHGFVSLSYASDGSLDSIWLDGRNMALGSDNMMIMSRRINSDGTFEDEQIIDDQTCECCPTSIARLADGSIISAFRDRSDDEIRNIHVRKGDENGWQTSAWSSSDGWKIAACPVNGPVVQSEGAHVAVAWFTAPEDVPAVHVSFSEDQGASFENTVSVHENRPIGRVGMSMLDEKKIVVTWIESGVAPADSARSTAAAEAGIKMRIVHTDGTLESTNVVAPTASSRASGYPRVATQDETLVFLWTQVGERNQVVSSIGKPTR